MEGSETQRLVEQLAAGFDALQEEYKSLYAQHLAVERKLATAREQYNELAKLSGLTTPPLSLSSRTGQLGQEVAKPLSTLDILDRRSNTTASGASGTISQAQVAAQTLRKAADTPFRGVRIWSGSAADRPDAGSSFMPSISESPLEQDFTIEGKPSKLGCPFAGMANKKLSSHAASVLSRYNNNTQGSIAPSSTPLSSVSRVNGKDSLSKRASRRASFADPIQTEICGLSGQSNAVLATEHANTEESDKNGDIEVGVCPIRFLDQHSPEEVATYFENHKHELPRSHEVCVRRYQSNEVQIKELDAKYGNLVSMIQGLGAKHKDMLPDDPEDMNEDPTTHGDSKSDEKVRKWASSVSAQAADGREKENVEVEEDRRSHFDRPLRDIRVGESPSRPWGIQVPVKYLEKEAGSDRSSQPARVVPAVHTTPQPEPNEQRKPGRNLVREMESEPSPQSNVTAPTPPAGKCPFDFSKAATSISNRPVKSTARHGPDRFHAILPNPPEPTAFTRSQPVLIDPQTVAHEATFASHEREDQREAANANAGDAQQVRYEPSPRMVFTGPVFLGYTAEDAAKILRESVGGAK